MDPKNSAEFIASNASHIKIDEERIRDLSHKICDAIKDGSVCVDNFSQCELHPNSDSADAVDWIFIVDLLNFCFWSDSNVEKWQVTFNGTSYTGYFALCAAINRGIMERNDLLQPEVFGKLSLDDLNDILRSDTAKQCPLIKDRQNCLQEAADVLIKKYKSSFRNCVEMCNHSAKKLLDTIVEDFPCFRDVAVYRGKKVSFYKRAQILIGDIWACFKGKGIGFFSDINVITMFADYRIPQVLVHFGVLNYSDHLLNILKSNKILESGCNEEIEIRGCTIHAVELLYSEITKLLTESGTDKEVNSILIDHFLWDYRRKYARELEQIPFHKVLGIFY